MDDNKRLRNIGSSEIEDIKEDLQSLKSNVVTLAQDIKNGGGAVARDSLDHLKAVGQEGFDKIENRVRENQGKALLWRFAPGWR